MVMSLMDLPLKAPEECRILIVDDEESLLELFKRTLNEDGFVVEVANSGEKALRMIHANPPDLVITDVVFEKQPIPDGFEICRTVKSEFSAAFIPVILITGFPAERIQGLNVGADDFLVKPVRRNELKVLVRSLIRTKQLYEMVVLSREELEKRVYIRTRELEEANLRLQELDTVKSNILQIISHELRTPLHRGRSALDLARSATDSDHLSENLLDTVERSFILLENRIEDIELFSDPGEIELDIYSVSDIFYGAVGQAEILADGHEGRIDVSITPGLPPIKAHARSISRALAHLIQNGMKFSDYQPVHLSAEVIDEGVLVQVRDHGPGIPEDIVAHLHEPIKQEDISTTRAHGGMGIGLALVSLIFDLHGITPSIVCREGEGTTISFTLPTTTL